MMIMASIMKGDKSTNNLLSYFSSHNIYEGHYYGSYEPNIWHHIVIILDKDNRLDI